MMGRRSHFSERIILSIFVAKLEKESDDNGHQEAKRHTQDLFDSLVFSCSVCIGCSAASPYLNSHLNNR